MQAGKGDEAGGKMELDGGGGVPGTPEQTPNRHHDNDHEQHREAKCQHFTAGGRSSLRRRRRRRPIMQ